MTVVVVHHNQAPVGAIGARRTAPELPEVISTLAERAVGVTMLTGDNVRTAHTLAAQAGVRSMSRQSCGRRTRRTPSLRCPAHGPQQ